MFWYIFHDPIHWPLKKLGITIDPNQRYAYYATTHKTGQFYRLIKIKIGLCKMLQLEKEILKKTINFVPAGHPIDSECRDAGAGFLFNEALEIFNQNNIDYEIIDKREVLCYYETPNAFNYELNTKCNKLKEKLDECRLQIQFESIKCFISNYNLQTDTQYYDFIEKNKQFQLPMRPDLTFAPIWNANNKWFEFLSIDTSNYILHTDKDKWAARCIELEIENYEDYMKNTQLYKDLPTMPEIWFLDYKGFSNEVYLMFFF